MATGRIGTTWAFDYSRGGTDWGIQIIHPHGRGQFIVHINHKGVGVSTPEHWSKHGYGMGESKRAKLTRAADKVFPLEEGAEYQVLSRVSPTGAWELEINGQVVASARATGAAPLSLLAAKGSRNDPEFKGEGLPLIWEPGYAALIVGPLDGGLNLCKNVRFAPSAAATVK